MPRGPKGEKRPADVIGAAVMVGKIATGEIDETVYVARRGFMTATDIKDATEKREPPTEASLLCRIDPKQFARLKSV
jgi:hypothetical protein